MKIGIITFHFVHNQGAVLQCYALQKQIRKLGHDPFIIDYRPSYHEVRYTAKKNPFVMAIGNINKHKKESIIKKIYFGSRGFLRAIRLTINKKDAKNDALFTEFRNKYFQLTKKYKSLMQLRKNPPEMDAYISGSDQLWNPELTDQRFDESYFLKFGSDDIKKITYAVSMKEHFSEIEKTELKVLCDSLDYISVREINDDLASVVNRTLVTSIDPTLLLNQEEYECIECKDETVLPGSPFLFVYGFENSEILYGIVEQISKDKGLIVVNGSPSRIHLNCKCIAVRDYAPDVFLAYIHHASYIVTNSFHGTALSLIYQKNFITVPHHSRGRRMEELLSKLGLRNRVYGLPEYDLHSEIDYESVQEKIEALRKEAISYIRMALGENERGN